MADETKSIWGKPKDADTVAGYEGADEYSEQGDERTVKALNFPFMVEVPNPMFVGADPMLQERIAQRGEKLTVDELGPFALQRGESLGAFYTDEELSKLSRAGVSTVVGELPPGPSAEDSPAFSEMGEHELAEYIEQNKPNINETIALAGDDPEAAKRVLEAENVATNNDPRTGVVNGLTAIIQRANQ